MSESKDKEIQISGENMNTTISELPFHTNDIKYASDCLSVSLSDGLSDVISSHRIITYGANELTGDEVKFAYLTHLRFFTNLTHLRDLASTTSFY
jgi:hypothetical protein